MTALSRYIDLHADKLDPETKERLARLPDNAIELVRAAFGYPEMSGLPDDIEDISKWRDYIRRKAPALSSLSDAELDLTLELATGESNTTDWYALERMMFMFELEDRLGSSDDVTLAFEDIISGAAAMVPEAIREKLKRYLRTLCQPLVDLELKRRRDGDIVS